MKTKYIIIAFVLTVLVQLAVPAQIVWENEQAYANGKEYKFKTQPIDPNDPFRGKYISLNFEADSADVKDSEWHADEGYVVLGTDKEGFAIIDTLMEEAPAKGDYVKVKVNYYYGTTAQVEYAFDRFYMEESKAPDAEKMHQSYISKENRVPAYAIVAVKGKVAVVKDVILDGMPIKEYVETHQNKPSGKKV
jgi:uncharacterized membrane-anchored protein